MGIKIPSSIRRICGEGAVEMASISSISKIGPNEKLRALWIRTTQEMVLVFSTAISVVVILFCSFRSMPFQIRDVLICNIQSIPIYMLASFWTTILHFMGHVALPGTAQVVSNLFISFIISFGLYYNSHYVPCIASFLPSLVYLAWSMMSVCILSIDEMPRWIKISYSVLQKYITPVFIPCSVVILIFHIITKKAILMKLNMFLLSSFLLMVLLLLISVLYNRKDLDRSYIMHLRPTLFRVLNFTLTVLIIFENLSFLNNAIMKNLILFNLSLVGVMLLNRLINGKVSFSFYNVIFASLEKKSILYIKIFAVMTSIVLVVLLLLSPYLFLKLIISVPTLLHYSVYLYYKLLYLESTPKLVREASYGFMEIFLTSIIGSFSGQILGLSSIIVYGKIDKGYIFFSSLVDRTMQAPLNVISSTMAAGLLPRISKMIKENNLKEAQKTFQSAMLCVFSIILPIMIIGFYGANFFFELFNRYGRQSKEDMAAAASMLRLQLLFFPFAVMHKIGFVICFSSGLHNIAMLSSWVSSISSVLFKFLMIQSFPDYLVMTLPTCFAWFLSCMLIVITTQFKKETIDMLEPFKRLFGFKKRKIELKSIEHDL